MSAHPSLFHARIGSFDQPGHTSEMTVRAASLLLKGSHPKDVARECGVSVRTAYRWRKGLRAVETVTVDGWTATFARFAYRPPLRISAWQRDKAA